jgi:hypothetical protein
METQNNRAVLDKHWNASAPEDLEPEHQSDEDNVVCEYPDIQGIQESGRRLTSIAC